MQEIYKQYVLSDCGEVMVQIPVAQFAVIEKLLEQSDQVILMEADICPQDESKAEWAEVKVSSTCELEYEDDVLVVKSQGVKIPMSIVDDMREDRIREIGGW